MSYYLILPVWSIIMLTFSLSDLVLASEKPNNPVKLLFIHHSVGGQWLSHGYGGLVNELNKNNYYINDVTYGWEPPELSNTLPKKINSYYRKVKRKIMGGKTSETGAYNIGNKTDIGHMPEWFLGPDSEMVMQAIYNEDLETTTFGDHSNSTSKTPLPNPGTGIENQIIMFKSCFPNTLLKGNPQEPAAQTNPPSHSFSAGSTEHTVANTKRIFIDVLTYFKRHPDKLFIIVTPPPQIILPENGNIARGFSNWLVHDWLKESNYNTGNVKVFDLFNILTSGPSSKENDAGQKEGNHHRIWKGEEQHITQVDNNVLVYPTNPKDDHPTQAGLQKATQEFVPLLNHWYAEWSSKVVH